MTPDERSELLPDIGSEVQTWWCSDCGCEHTASVIGGLVVPPLESSPLHSLSEVESAREEREDYERGWLTTDDQPQKLSTIAPSGYSTVFGLDGVNHSWMTLRRCGGSITMITEG